jgi:L-iditol 2-dehydrogenase
MRASALLAPHRLELVDVADPPMGPRDVRLRPAVVGLCGTDFHIVSGEGNYNLDASGVPIPLSEHPQILGHEITGVVLEVGDDVTDLAPGARVVVDQGLACSAHGTAPCEYCRTGDSHQCAQYAELGITGVPGGLADELVVPAVNVVAVPDGLPLDRAVLAEPLGCVLHALDAVANAAPRWQLDGTGEGAVNTVLIAGAGPAGLLFVQVLQRVLGWQGTVLVSEPDVTKRVLATTLGAEVLAETGPELVDTVRARTGGRGVELLIDACGAGALFESIPGLIRSQATVLLYGHGHGGVGLEALNAVQWREPRLVSPCGASGPIDADGRPSVYRRAVELIASGTISVEPLITHRYVGLDAVPAAFGGDHLEPGYVKGLAVLDPTA